MAVCVKAALLESDGTLPRESLMLWVSPVKFHGTTATTRLTPLSPKAALVVLRWNRAIRRARFPPDALQAVASPAEQYHSTGRLHNYLT